MSDKTLEQRVAAIERALENLPRLTALMRIKTKDRTVEPGEAVPFDLYDRPHAWAVDLSREAIGNVEPRRVRHWGEVKERARKTTEATETTRAESRREMYRAHQEHQRQRREEEAAKAKAAAERDAKIQADYEQFAEKMRAPRPRR